MSRKTLLGMAATLSDVVGWIARKLDIANIPAEIESARQFHKLIQRHVLFIDGFTGAILLLD